MVAPSAVEKKLLELSKSFDSAISSKDAAKLDALLADGVTVHQDGIALHTDLNGKGAVRKYFEAYFDKYEFQHETVAGAVNDTENTAFSFWVDKDVTPKPGKFDENLPEHATKPSTVVGIWFHELDSSHKVKDIWFLRQLSNDELHRKLQGNPPQKSLDTEKWKGSGKDGSEERRKEMGASAMVFNDIWAKRDAEAADTIMVDDVTQWDPVLGKELHGRDKFKELIRMYSENWEPKDNIHHFAVSAGNKAFIYWCSKGKHIGGDNSEERIYGLNMLAFNDDGKITEVVGFRQPSSNEAKKLLKNTE